MAEMAKCCVDGCAEERKKGKSYCATHWRDYTREYEARSDRKRLSAEFHRGLEEGMKRAISFLRLRLGDRAATGHQAAQLIERNIILGDSQELMQRRLLVDSLRGSAPPRQQ